VRALRSDSVVARWSWQRGEGGYLDALYVSVGRDAGPSTSADHGAGGKDAGSGSRSGFGSGSSKLRGKGSSSSDGNTKGQGTIPTSMAIPPR
jgi:hypothetical protein